MVTLTGQQISDSFKDLLQVSNNNSGIDATVRPLEDGEGTQGPFSVSTGVFRLNAGTAVDASAGASMDFTNIAVSNLPVWKKLSQVSPVDVSSFQIVGLPATAVAVLITCADMDYDQSTNMSVAVMDDSVVQTSDYHCVSIMFDQTITVIAAVTTINLHMIRLSNVDGQSTQSCLGMLVRNGTTNVWTWTCSGTNDQTIDDISYAHAIGVTPEIVGTMNGFEFSPANGDFKGGTVTVYYQEEIV